MRKSLGILLCAVSFFISLSIWAFASPPGSAPDDDFHLPAIWCSHGKVDGIVKADKGVIKAIQEIISAKRIFFEEKIAVTVNKTIANNELKILISIAEFKVFSPINKFMVQ